MSFIDIDIATISGIPDLHRAVIGTRGDALAIGRPRHRFYSIRMPLVGVDVATIDSMPDLRSAVSGARGDALAIGGPRYCSHPIRMPTIRVDISPNCRRVARSDPSS